MLFQFVLAREMREKDCLMEKMLNHTIGLDQNQYKIDLALERWGHTKST